MKNIFFCTAFLLLASLAGYSQNLNTGDIVVIGYAADTGTPSIAYNEFSWVPLVDLQAGTKIYFTDAGYNSQDANFMGTGLNDEILLRYITPETGIPAGTVLTVTEEMIAAHYTVITGTKFGNDFNSLLTLPNAGDQITVFQSDDDETVPATFGNTSFHAIFMVTGSTLSFTALTSTTAGVTPTFNLDNVTNLAPGLTNTVNAVAVGTGPLEADESDNARYIGITSGTRAEILHAVSQLANWSRHDVAFKNDLVFGSTANGWTTNSISQFAITPMSIPENAVTKISLYPNPAATVFSVENETGQKIKEICIYTINGTIAQKFDVLQSRYDISALAGGIYFVEIMLEDIKITKKLILH